MKTKTFLLISFAIVISTSCNEAPVFYGKYQCSNIEINYDLGYSIDTNGTICYNKVSDINLEDTIMKYQLYESFLVLNEDKTFKFVSSVIVDSVGNWDVKYSNENGYYIDLNFSNINAGIILYKFEDNSYENLCMSIPDILFIWKKALLHFTFVKSPVRRSIQE